MKFGLLRYATSFICDYSVEEATERIINVAECSEDRLEIKKIYYSEKTRIILNAHTASVLYRNSFMPQVKIDLTENGANTIVLIKFEPRISVKIFIYTWLLLCLIALLIVLSNINLVDPKQEIVGIVATVAVLLSVWCLSSLGLKLPSKKIANTLFCTLTEQSENCCSKLHRW